MGGIFDIVTRIHICSSAPLFSLRSCSPKSTFTCCTEDVIIRKHICFNTPLFLLLRLLFSSGTYRRKCNRKFGRCMDEPSSEHRPPSDSCWGKTCQSVFQDHVFPIALPSLCCLPHWTGYSDGYCGSVTWNSVDEKDHWKTIRDKSGRVCRRKQRQLWRCWSCVS